MIAHTTILDHLVLSLAAFLLLAVPVADAGPPGEPHEVVDDPYLAPPAIRTTSPPAEVVRDGFVSVQVNLDAAGHNIVGDAANEPSIAVDPTDPMRIAIGWRQFDTVASNFRQAGVGFSRDGGRTWTFPGPLDPGVFRSDPVLDAASDGTFHYDSLRVQGYDYWCELFSSADAGSSWTAPVYAYGGDKAWMAVDRTGGIGEGNIYQAWDYAGCCGDDWFNRSTDGAASWQPAIAIPGQPFWGVTTIGPDGTVYIAGTTDFDTGFAVAASSTVQDPGQPMAFDGAWPVDLGGSLLYFLGYGPNPGGLLGQVWIAADHSGGPSHGTLYVLASVDPPGPDPLDVHLVRSNDGGQTWSTPVRVNDDPPGSNAWQWFGTLAVAPDGRLDVIWNDTRNSGGGLATELYYASSTDGGVTFAPGQPVSPPFDPHLGWPNQDKLGDYYDMVSDLVGADVAYAATFNGEQDVYHLRIGDYDCNSNGTGDADDIAAQTSTDRNDDGIPDECQSLIFADGFGSGDTSAWNAVVP